MALVEQYQTQKVYLPSTQDKPEDERLWVVVKDRLYFGDMLPAFEVAGEQAKKVAGVAQMIVDWNFEVMSEDNKRVTLPVTLDNIKDHLKWGDFQFLVTIHEALFDKATETLGTEEKKDSGSTLTPPTTVEPTTPTV